MYQCFCSFTNKHLIRANKSTKLQQAIVLRASKGGTTTFVPVKPPIIGPPTNRYNR